MIDLHVTMFARAVVASGHPFVRRDVSFTDADVALDEVQDLRAGSDPLVLRVRAVGGTAAEREKVVGDWLCDSDGSAPAPLPVPEWSYDELPGTESRSRVWSRAMGTWVGAWDSCDDARWMLHAAVEIGAAHDRVVLAACACARTALHFLPAGEGRARRAIEAAEAWARGRASREEVDAAGEAAHEAMRAYYNESRGEVDSRDDAASAAAGAAWVATASSRSYMAVSAARVAADVADAFTSQFLLANMTRARLARVEALRVCAGIVREHIQTIDVLRAAARFEKPERPRTTAW